MPDNLTNPKPKPDRVSLTQPARPEDYVARARDRECPTCGDTAGWCQDWARCLGPVTFSLPVDGPVDHDQEEPVRWEP